MQKFKRFLSMLLVIVMVVGMVPVNVFATETETVITCEHSYAEGVCTACGAAESEATEPEETEPEGENVVAVVNDEPVAKVGDIEYTDISEAIKAWANGTTLTLLSDVTLTKVIELSSTEYHILDLGTYTMTAASWKDAIQIVNNGRSSASYALDIKADATNPGGITASGKAVVKTTGKTGVQDRPIIRFYNGVFNASNIVSHSGSNGTNCPQFWFYGGEFNGTIYANRALFQFYGGTFNGNLQISVDSSAYALISGGKFKKLSNLYGSSLNSDKFTIGSAKGNFNRGIYVDSEGYYVVTSEVIKEVSAKYPAVKKESYNSNNYFKYSAAATYGMFYEVASMAGTGSNVTIWEKPAVTIPENVTGDAAVVEEIKNNTALKDYTPVNLPAGAELEIELVSVGETIVYDVTPMASGAEVEPTEAITFRLPVPASVTSGFAKVYHDGTLMGIYEIKGEGNAKYVEVSSADFSKFKVEPTVNAPVAQIGEVGFATVQEALQAAIDTGASELKILCDVSEKMATDFDLVIKSDLTITADAPVKVEFYNEGTAYDFAVGSTNNNTLTIGENVHFDLIDRVIWLGYYGNNVDVVVEGYLGGYQIWHGADTTVTETGKLDSHGEAFIMRRDATLTVEGGEVNANYFHIYSGHIDAEDATITAGLVWIYNDHSYGSEGTVSMTLDNTSFTSNGEVKVYAGEGKEVPITVTNGSSFKAAGALTTGANVVVTADATSTVTDNKGSVFAVMVNDQPFFTLEAAAAAAQAGDTIVLLKDVTLSAELTLPADITLNGNGKQINGSIVAGGNLTFAGHTKVTNFNAGYEKPVITIGVGATLELTGTGRMVIGHGATFNITGEITDAKTADKADIKPSLIAAGASFTGAGVNFNVTNAYVQFTAYCSSKNSSANGTFNINVTNSIWEQTGSLVFTEPTSGKDPTFNFTVKDSVLDSTSHLVFGVTKGEIVFDNSNVNVGNYRQLENRSNLTIKNGSVVYASVQISSNAKNPGTTIVDNATYVTTGEFSGADVGTGTIIIKKGANFTTGKVTKADIVIDAADMTAGELADFNANLSNFAGTLSVINNSDLYAKIVDGKIVLCAYAAKIGETGYKTFAEAMAAAQAGETVVLMADVELTDTLTIAKSITLDGNGHKLTPADSTKTYNSAIMVGDSGWGDDHGETITLKGLTFEGWKTIYGVVRAQGVTLAVNECEFKNNSVSNYAYAVLSLNYTDATVSSTKFVGNNDRVIDVNYNGDDSEAVVTIDGCTFEGNTTTGAGIVMRSDGTMAVKNSAFKNNTVNTNGNGATVYVGFGAGHEVSGCTFEGNTVITSHTSTKRFASAIFCDGCTVSGNVFGEGNTATRNGETISTVVAVGAYYGAADISGNYWGGAAPVPGVDYLVEYSNQNVAIEDYCSDKELTTKVEISNVAKVGQYYYTSLADAIDAAQNGKTITLLADVNEAVTISGKQITLDLNGKKISGGDTDAVSVMSGANVTIKNGTLETYGTNCGGVWVKGATARIENCTVNGLADEEPVAVYASNGATVTIKDSALTAKDNGTEDVWALVLMSADVTVENSVLNGYHAASGNGSDGYDQGKLTITSGEFNGLVYWPAQGKLTINGGEIDEILMKSGSMEITAGNVGDIKIENVADGGYETIGTVAITGGTFTGTVESNLTEGFISGGIFTTDVSDYLAEGLMVKQNENGTFGVVEDPAYGKVALVGGEYYETVQEALQAAIDTGASELKILCDVREQMENDFDLVINADLTITADAPVKVEFYNEGTAYDFAVGSTNNNTLTIDENVHFDLIDRVIWLGYWGNNVDVVVNGYLGGYQIWHGADTTVTATGKLDSHGEAFVMRRDATLTVDGGKVNANYFHIYSGHIDAENATITAGLVWIYNNHSYGLEGTVSMDLDNTDFTSRGEVKVYAGEGKEVPITVTNGSSFQAAGALTIGENVTITADANSAFNDRYGTVFVAAVNGQQFSSLSAAVKAVAESGTVTMLANVELTESLVIPADKTVVLNLNGKTISQVKEQTAAYSMIINNGTLTIQDESMARTAATGTISYTDSGNGGNYVSNTILNNGTLTVAGGTLINDSSDAVAQNGFPHVIDNNAKLTVAGGVLTNEKYSAIRVWCTTDDNTSVAITGGTINGAIDMHNVSGAANKGTLTITGGILNKTANANVVRLVNFGNDIDEINVSIEGGWFGGGIGIAGSHKDVDLSEVVEISDGVFTVMPDKKLLADDYAFDVNDNGEYVVNVKPVASVDGEDYTSLADAFVAAAESGEPVYLKRDLTLTETITVSAGQTVVLNLRGFTITGIDNNTSGNFYLFNVNKGNLTIKDTKGTGEITLTAVNERNWSASSVVVANSCGTLTVESGTIKHLGGTDMAYGIDNLTNGNIGAATTTITGGVVDSTYFAVRQFANSASAMNTVTVNGGEVGYMWMQSPNNNANTATTVVNGGTVDGICLSGVNAALTLKVAANTTGEIYGTAPKGMVVVGTPETGFNVVKAAASVGSTDFATLAEAFAAAQDGDTITVLDDIALSENITNTKKVTLDLNGKTITGTDTATASFSLFTNKGELTVTGSGTMTLTATNNRGWNAYSSVISNTVGGKLIVESGTIKHLGGTDMAYGIDNLTNGKGTYAETVINGGTIKSTYRAVRQFLNGIEARNILTVNGGIIEGANKSIWMQDPSANANTGKLTVGKNAVINGDIYLFVCEGSTEWPVEVSIAASAVNGEVISGNVPVGYDVVESNGIIGVKSVVAQVGDVCYETLAAAIAAANGAEIVVLKDITEEFASLDNVTLTTNVDAGVTITNTYTNWISLTNINVGKGVTLHMDNTLFDDAGENVIEGTIETDTTFYHAYNSKTIVRNGGKIIATGMIVNRYHTDPEAGIYVYGDGDASTVEVTSADTIGTYSGTFYVKDAVVEGEMLWLDYKKGTNEEADKYSVSNAVFENAVLNVASELRLYKDASLTLTGTSVTAGKVQIRENATPTVAVDSTSTIKAASVENLTGAAVIAVRDDEGNITFEKVMMGQGTAEDPYRIENAEQLFKFAEKVNSGEWKTVHAVLVADIDLDQEDWTPIKQFNGTFDGNGYKISNVWAVGNGNQGFFAQVAEQTETVSGTVKNVTFNNVTIISSDGTAGLIADARLGARISNVKLTGEVTIQGYRGVGGIVGAGFPQIDGCSVEAEGTITATYWGAGGILGFANDVGAKVTNSTVTGTGDGLEIHGALGGVGSVTGTPYGAAVNGADISNVDITSTSNYYMAYIDASGTVTNATVSDVHVKVNGEEIIGRDAVATIGEDIYFSLADAVAAAETGETVKLVTDVKLTDTLVIPADKTITLDLNGKTISQSKACTASYTMIKNEGNLTITGNGKISFTDTGAGDPNFTWGSYTITNLGTLVVENGTIEHLGEQAFATHMICAIQQASGSTTINGGTISTPSYRSVRINGGSLTVSGGTFDGQIWLQPNKADAQLYVTDGTFEPNGRDASAIFMSNVGEGKTVTEASITGGTFNGKIGASDASALAGCITGGTFSGFNPAGGTLLSETHCAAEVDGKYVIAEKKYVSEYTAPTFEADGYTTYTCEHCGHTYVETDEGTKLHAVAKIGATKFGSFADAYAAANANDTIVLLDNTSESVSIDKPIALDMNGWTYSGKVTLTTLDAALTAVAGLDVVTALADHKVVRENDTYKVVEMIYVAQVGEKKFESLAEAIAAAQANDTITLLADVSENVTIDKAVTLVLNRMYYTGTVTLTVNGVLTAPAGLNVEAETSADESVENSVVYKDGAYQVAVSKYVAKIGENKYASLSAALAAAVSGDVVVMLVDYTDNVYATMVPAGVTLNLNGTYLTAQNLIAFGSVVDVMADETQGKGGVKISNDRTKAFVQLQQSNTYLPIYDTTDGCYRFFEYSMGSLAAQDRSKDKSVPENAARFRFRLKFTDAAAYKLLTETEDSGVTLVVSVTWSGQDHPVTFSIKDANLRSFAQNAYTQMVDKGKVSQVTYLTLCGLDTLESGAEIAAVPVVQTCAGVSGVSKTIPYTIP